MAVSIYVYSQIASVHFWQSVQVSFQTFYMHSASCNLVSGHCQLKIIRLMPFNADIANVFNSVPHNKANGISPQLLQWLLSSSCALMTFHHWNIVRTIIVRPHYVFQKLFTSCNGAKC